MEHYCSLAKYLQCKGELRIWGCASLFLTPREKCHEGGTSPAQISLGGRFGDEIVCIVDIPQQRQEPFRCGSGNKFFVLFKKARGLMEVHYRLSEKTAQKEQLTKQEPKASLTSP